VEHQLGSGGTIEVVVEATDVVDASLLAEEVVVMVIKVEVSDVGSAVVDSVIVAEELESAGRQFAAWAMPMARKVKALVRSLEEIIVTVMDATVTDRVEQREVEQDPRSG
jgi:hypothetical protein